MNPFGRGTLLWQISIAWLKRMAMLRFLGLVTSCALLFLGLYKGMLTLRSMVAAQWELLVVIPGMMLMVAVPVIWFGRGMKWVIGKKVR